MSNIPERPANLPDFELPPLNEVVVGIQFNTPKGYQQIYAGNVWELFKTDFPKVEEREPLTPTFETFGLPSKGIHFDVMAGPIHDRFWFLRQDGSELIQFQQDRLLHNWRKVGDKENEYPRFEGMMGRFSNEVERLEQYFNELFSQSLLISQCEISYINHIPFEIDNRQKSSDWVRVVDFGGCEPEDFSLSFREIIRDDDGQPQGRLTCDFKVGIKQNGQRVIVMTLTARGAPKEPTKESAFEFITMGRSLIVSRFTDLTTEMAHEQWRRIK